MTIEQIREAAAPILRRHGVARAFVFGSCARNLQREGSDVDILVEYAPGARRSLLARARLISELREALQRDVDVVTEASLSRSIRENVLRERKAIL